MHLIPLNSNTFCILIHSKHFVNCSQLVQVNAYKGPFLDGVWNYCKISTWVCKLTSNYVIKWPLNTWRNTQSVTRTELDYCNRRTWIQFSSSSLASMTTESHHHRRRSGSSPKPLLRRLFRRYLVSWCRHRIRHPGPPIDSALDLSPVLSWTLRNEIQLKQN